MKTFCVNVAIIAGAVACVVLWPLAVVCVAVVGFAYPPPGSTRIGNARRSARRAYADIVSCGLVPFARRSSGDKAQ